MDPKQQRTVEVLERVEAGRLGPARAAELIGVGIRQLQRLRADYRQEGMMSVVHGNAGRAPANRLDPALIARILALAGPDGKYHDLNVCHLHELLAAEEDIQIGRSTLDRLLKEAGLRQARRRAHPGYRQRRARRAAEGMLLQMDGSPFAWLEGRGPKASLIGAIDDATSRVVGLLFRPTEDQLGYLLLLRTVAQTHGLPMSIYHDRHTILRSPKQATLDEQLAGQPPMSQVQRILAELGVEAIPAYSPQAKGRIERLWGTLQDRLTKELRLAEISTLEQANAFLPGFIARHNTRFAQPAQDPESAWVPLPADLDVDYYFATAETRKVSADHCISYGGQHLQLCLAPAQPSLVDQTVSVHVTPEGALHVYLARERLAHRPAAARPRRSRPAEKEPAWTKLPADPQAQARKRAWLHGSG